MSFIDLPSVNAVLKELYDGQKVQNMVYKDNPFAAMLSKATNRGGKYYPIPIQIGTSQGRSSTFANAQANQSANSYQEFLIKWKSDYSLATLDHQTMLAAKTDPQAFISTAKAQVDGAMRTIKNSLGSAVFRSGTGSIGAIGTISTGVITLTNPGDIVQFSLNMVLQANATDGGTPRAASGYVIALNKAAGQFTVSATAGGSAGTPTSWAAADFLLVSGDNNAKVSGLSAWLPFTAPTTGDSFFGVDRSVDTVALAGNRYDGSTQSIEEAIQDALNNISTLGDGSTDYLITNPNTYTALEKSLGSKVQYVDMKANPEVGFRGIMINGPRGQVNVLSDRNCPALTGYALQMDTWTLGSLGEAPFIFSGDGVNILRLAASDAYELRVGYFAQLECTAPGYNGVIKFSA